MLFDWLENGLCNSDFVIGIRFVVLYVQLNRRFAIDHLSGYFQSSFLSRS